MPFAMIFSRSSIDLRTDIFKNEQELDAVMLEPDIDVSKAIKIQNAIPDLRAQFARKRLQAQIAVHVKHSRLNKLRNCRGAAQWESDLTRTRVFAAEVARANRVRQRYQSSKQPDGRQIP